MTLKRAHRFSSKGATASSGGDPTPRVRRKSISTRTANAELKRQAERITDSDLETVLGKERKIRALVGKGPLSKVLTDVQLLLALIRAYWKGEYREIPWFSMAAIVAALLYVLNPLDLIPDAIPIIGQLDDLAVVAACLAMVREDLARFAAWQNRGRTKAKALNAAR